MQQEDIFLASEGDAWFERNRDVINSASHLQTDPVLALIRQYTLLQPEQTVLEIGCSNGYRLHFLHAHYRAQAYGIDPSQAAIQDAQHRFPSIDAQVGLAHQLDFADRFFDLVIFGFCLYVCSPEHLPTIIAEANRVLKSTGHIIIYDFLPKKPERRPYHHRAGIYSHKRDFGSLFAKAGLTCVEQRQVHEHDQTGITLLAQPPIIARNEAT